MREMKGLIRAFRPVLVILLEPKISGAGAYEVCRKLGLSRWGRSEASSFSGGIWVLGKEAEIRWK